MWRPRLNKNHIAGDQTGGIGTTPGILPAVQNDRPVAIRRIPQDFVKVDGKSIQMTNMERTKIRMEGVVEECIVNREIYRSS